MTDTVRVSVEGLLAALKTVSQEMGLMYLPLKDLFHVEQIELLEQALDRCANPKVYLDEPQEVGAVVKTRDGIPWTRVADSDLPWHYADLRAGWDQLDVVEIV